MNVSERDLDRHINSASVECCEICEKPLDEVESSIYLSGLPVICNECIEDNGAYKDRIALLLGEQKVDYIGLYEPGSMRPFVCAEFSRGKWSVEAIIHKDELEVMDMERADA